jgi:uncharacterized membrane protein YbhN (UPF0104 family)
MWSGLLRLLRWVTGSALIAWLVWWVDWRRFAMACASSDPAWAATGMAVFGLAIVPAALRLQVLLQPHGIGFGQALRLTLASGFFNLLLPTGFGGDAYRAMRLARAAGGWAPTIGLLVLERGIGAIALLAPALACLVLARAEPQLAASWPEGLSGTALAPWVMAAIGAALAALAWMLITPHRRIACIRDDVVASLRGLTLASLAWMLALSLAFHALRVLGTLAFLEAVGHSVALGGLVVAMAMTQLASLVPVSVGALGVREGALVFGLAAYGVPEAAALTVALLGRLVVVSLGLLGALAFHAERSASMHAATNMASGAVAQRSDASAPGSG